MGEVHGGAARDPALQEGDHGGAGKGEDDEGTEMQRARRKADRAWGEEEAGSERLRWEGETEEPRGALPPQGRKGRNPWGWGAAAGWLAGLCCPLLAAVPPAEPAHLLLRVLEGDHQDHVPSLKLQLVRVGGRVVVLGLNLQRVGER